MITLQIEHHSYYKFGLTSFSGACNTRKLKEGCNTKRMAGLAFLEKKFVFQSEKSTYSLTLFSKIEKFYRIKDFFKVNKIDIPDYQ